MVLLIYTDACMSSYSYINYYIDNTEIDGQEVQESYLVGKNLMVIICIYFIVYIGKMNVMLTSFLKW